MLTSASKTMTGNFNSSFGINLSSDVLRNLLVVAEAGSFEWDIRVEVVDSMLWAIVPDGSKLILGSMCDMDGDNKI